MILAKLVAATLAFGVATGPDVETSVRDLSFQQRNAAAQNYVRSATDCIARSVTADVRFHTDDPADRLGDLIVDAVPNCLKPVHAMMDAYDHYFGQGAGEEFFAGPYLDVLPNVILKKMKTLKSEERGK
jgi:hypothetical protein